MGTVGIETVFKAMRLVEITRKVSTENAKDKDGAPALGKGGPCKGDIA